MKAFVIVPTYNESENIQNLLNELIQLDIEIVVVDDNSPDGTSGLVQKMQKKSKKIHLITRTTERGRGTAGIAGFKYALSKGADVVGEMDADYSHNPKYIPDLLEKIKECDIVLGSRLVKGGKDIGRPLLRRIITILANLYIQIILGIKARDCNSGYRFFKREVLESIELDKMVSQGPSIVQEMLYKTHLKGFKICEVPIHFVERELGKSKLGFKQLYKGYIMVLKLKWWRIIGRI
ncbi:MAG: polyprenol monophosphomannose synthase [Candidatus Woesearchaeota archaeon]